MFKSVLSHLSLAIVLLMAVAIPAHIADAEIQWEKSLEEGMKVAAEADKPLMLDFYTNT